MYIFDCNFKNGLEGDQITATFFTEGPSIKLFFGLIQFSCILNEIFKKLAEESNDVSL